MTEVFVSKSVEVCTNTWLYSEYHHLILILNLIQLRDCLLEQIAASPRETEARVEIMSWLSRATLDMIGLAGFNYSFDALKFGEDSNELAHAFSQIFSTTQGASPLSLLRANLKILRWIVCARLVLFVGSCQLIDVFMADMG
jgi:hypothetical protein